MNKLKIKKGGKYITAEGEMVTIKLDMNEDIWKYSTKFNFNFIGSNHFNYNSKGENISSVHRKNIVRKATLWDKVKRWFS